MNALEAAVLLQRKADEAAESSRAWVPVRGIAYPEDEHHYQRVAAALYAAAREAYWFATSPFSFISEDDFGDLS